MVATVGSRPVFNTSTKGSPFLASSSVPDLLSPQDSVKLENEDDDVPGVDVSHIVGTGGVSPLTGHAKPAEPSAVSIAKKYLGKDSGSFTFKNYDHPGGQDNDCAGFVSGCLADAGKYKPTANDDNVGAFQTSLKHQGWKQTTKPQPGDVAIVNGDQHAELVAGKNGKCIGSNNVIVDGQVTSQQRVSYDTPSQWGSVVYWAPPATKG